jgi:hypothetical protein
VCIVGKELQEELLKFPKTPGKLANSFLQCFSRDLCGEIGSKYSLKSQDLTQKDVFLLYGCLIIGLQFFWIGFYFLFRLLFSNEQKLRFGSDLKTFIQ